MNGILLAGLLAVGFAAALEIERKALARFRRKIPLRIAVTGTRGKSSVARFIAAALRENGMSVLAKTTGSKPVLIRPDGSARDIPRFGPPSILEQKRILRAAARSGAHALVAEMMSIRPECLKAETSLILKPSILVITNARIDHRLEMGRTKEDAARALASAIGAGMAVFVPAEENRPVYETAAARYGSRVIPVAKNAGDSTGDVPRRTREFPENERLAEAVAVFLGVPGERARAGMARAQADFGALRVWKLKESAGGSPSYAVSAFAANEPESTAIALDRLAVVRPDLPSRAIAILSLREDREDRTRQWLEAAGKGFFAGFAGIIVVGRPAIPAARRLRRTIPPGRFIFGIAESDPARIMAAAGAQAGSFSAVFIGVGNIGGTGAALVDLWGRVGEPD